MKYIGVALALLCLWFTGCGLTQEEIDRRNNYLERAQDYHKNKKFNNALQQVERALEIDPECKAALIAKGSALFYLGNYDVAEESYQQAYRLDNTDPWLHFGLGSIAFKRGSEIEVKMANLTDSAYLFSIDASCRADLDLGRVSPKIRDAFQRNESTLSADVKVEIPRLASEWHIEDGNKEYLVLSAAGKDPENAKLEDTLNVYAFDRLKSALEKYAKEKELWYQKSIEHFEVSRKVQTENPTLFKTIALVHAARGVDHYARALENLDRYVHALDEDVQLVDAEIALIQQQRGEPGLVEKQKEELDLAMGDLEPIRKENRREYRIAQALAAELFYRLAYREKQKAAKAVNDRVRAKNLEKMHEYAYQSSARLDLILKTDPNLANQYLNHATVAKLEENYDLAIKYLEEYIRHCPLGDPKVMVKVREDIELMGRHKDRSQR